MRTTIANLLISLYLFLLIFFIMLNTLSAKNKPSTADKRNDEIRVNQLFDEEGKLDILTAKEKYFIDIFEKIANEHSLIFKFTQKSEFMLKEENNMIFANGMLSEKWQRVFAQIANLKKNSTYPFSIRMIYQFNNDEISEEDDKNILNATEQLLNFRQAIINLGLSSENFILGTLIGDNTSLKLYFKAL